MAEKTKKEMVLQNTANNLNALIVAKASAMPEGFNQTRFLQNCMTVLQDTKNIEECQPLSIARTMLKGAFLGLDFFQKECYAIPYGVKTAKGWAKELQFQTDYKGETKMAKKYSIRPIKDIYAKVVRKGDGFKEEIYKGSQYITFTPLAFNNEEIIGAFAVVLYKDGGMEYETMSKEEIEAVKTNYAKTDKDGKYSKAWEVSAGEMYKKTVLRRLTKKIEKDFGSIETAKAYEESSEFTIGETPESIVNPFEQVEDVIEATAEVVSEEEEVKEAETDNAKEDETNGK
ncbi:MAG: recombinase RecT [Aminipila sp.]